MFRLLSGKASYSSAMPRIAIWLGDTTLLEVRDVAMDSFDDVMVRCWMRVVHDQPRPWVYLGFKKNYGRRRIKPKAAKYRWN